MCSDCSIIETDEQLCAAVNSVIASLEDRFARAHYKVDIESNVWFAAATLFEKPKEQRTEKYLYVIAYRLTCKELQKMRFVFPEDMQNDVYTDLYLVDDMTIAALDTSSLTEEELRMLNWFLEDGLTQGDVGELLGISRDSVKRKWKRIKEKLRLNN